MTGGGPIVNIERPRKARLRAKLASTGCVLIALSGIAGYVGAFFYNPVSVKPVTTSRIQSRPDYQQEIKQLRAAVFAIQQQYPHTPPTPSKALTLVKADGRAPVVQLTKGAKQAVGDLVQLEIKKQPAPGTLELYAPTHGQRYSEVEAKIARDGTVSYQIYALPHGLFLGLVLTAACLALATCIPFGLLGAFRLPERDRQKQQKELPLLNWRQVISSEYLGPDSPREKFAISHPEAELVEDSEGLYTRFSEARYVFDNGSWCWIYAHPPEDPKYQRLWTADEQVEMIGAWVEFCNEVAEQNISSWQAVQAEEQRKLLAEQQTQMELEQLRAEAERKRLDPREFLPAASEVVDLASIAQRQLTS